MRARAQARELVCSVAWGLCLFSMRHPSRSRSRCRRRYHLRLGAFVAVARCCGHSRACVYAALSLAWVKRCRWTGSAELVAVRSAVLVGDMGYPRVEAEAYDMGEEYAEMDWDDSQARFARTENAGRLLRSRAGRRLG